MRYQFLIYFSLAKISLALSPIWFTQTLFFPSFPPLSISHCSSSVSISGSILFLSLAHSSIILMKIWWDIISPTDCPHYWTMPASCASISGIVRSTFDLNSVRFLRCRFTRGRLFHLAGLRPSVLRFSVDGPWRSTSTCAQLGFPAINSAEGQRIGFLCAVKVSEREPKGNSGNKMESPVLWRASEFSGSGSYFLRLGLRD